MLILIFYWEEPKKVLIIQTKDEVKEEPSGIQEGITTIITTEET